MEQVEAKIVNDTNGLFDIDTPLKEFTVEDILKKCIVLLKLQEIKIEELKILYLYLGELYRRNITFRYDCVYKFLLLFPGVLKSLFCKETINSHNIFIYNKLYQLLPNLYSSCILKLQEIQMVKDTMKFLKMPLLTKELEECMDEILDLNGNKISQMKDYLTEDQYRFVRSGAKFEQLDGQQDMLSRMNKMLEDLKKCIRSEVLSPIHHLEKEFTSYKIKQLNHEKDLEKLLKNTKI